MDNISQSPQRQIALSSERNELALSALISIIENSKVDPGSGKRYQDIVNGSFNLGSTEDDNIVARLSLEELEKAMGDAMDEDAKDLMRQRHSELRDGKIEKELKVKGFSSSTKRLESIAAEFFHRDPTSDVLKPCAELDREHHKIPKKYPEESKDWKMMDDGTISQPNETLIPLECAFAQSTSLAEELYTKSFCVLEDEIKNGNVWGWSVLDNNSPPVKKMMMPRQDQHYKCMLRDDQQKVMELMKKDKDDVFVLARKVILGTYSDGSKA